jgi:hypothetical protein
MTQCDVEVYRYFIRISSAFVIRINECETSVRCCQTAQLCAADETNLHSTHNINTFNGFALYTLTAAGVYRTGVYRTGVYRTGVYRTGVYRTGVYRTGVYRTGVYRTGVYRTGVYRTGAVLCFLNLTSCNGKNYIILGYPVSDVRYSHGFGSK